MKVDDESPESLDAVAPAIVCAETRPVARREPRIRKRPSSSVQAISGVLDPADAHQRDERADRRLASLSENVSDGRALGSISGVSDCWPETTAIPCARTARGRDRRR